MYGGLLRIWLRINSHGRNTDPPGQIFNFAWVDYSIFYPDRVLHIPPIIHNLSGRIIISPEWIGGMIFTMC